MAPLHLEWNALDPEVACPPLVQGQYTEPVAPDKTFHLRCSKHVNI